MRVNKISQAICVAFIAASVLSACEQPATPNQNPQSDSSTEESGHTRQFHWFAGETPAGETTITQAGDGRISNESFVHWNNREYRLNSEIQLDANGMIISQTITGQSPFGAPVNESFSLTDGLAQWKTTGEGGSARAGKPAFYLANQWGASASLAALIRAAAKTLDGELAIFPDGKIRVEKRLTTPVNTGNEEVMLSLYSVSGINFTPVFAWFDEEMQLVSRYLGRLGMVPDGWEPATLAELGRIQAQQSALMIEQTSESLTRKLDRPVIFENVDLVDVEAGELLSGYYLMAHNGTIQAISNLPLEDDSAIRIDGKGKTLIPGLWDMHGHQDLDEGILNIAAGVTSVRDLGSVHERIMELTEKFDSGRVIGPNTYRAAMIDQAGPYANRNPVSSQSEALELIDRFASQGYIQIKLYSSIDPEWVPAIAERAHSHGMRLSGHIPAFMSAEQAVKAGFDEIQHINMVFLNFLAGDREDTRQQLRFTLYGSQGGKLDLDSPEVETFISLLKENDVVVDPTAAIFESMMIHVAGEPDPTFAAVADHLPAGVRRGLYNPSFEIGEDRLDDWAATAVRQGEMIRKLHESGIQLVAGTDNIAGFTLHRELEVYAEAGISNADVLKIATIDSARVIGLEESTGSIDVGKASDLVLLDGNPLEDISAVRRAALVMKGNSIYKPDELYTAVGIKPFGYSGSIQSANVPANPDFEYRPYSKNPGDLAISRSAYFDKLQGFWLGQCIANWTGLVTEMDKIGGEGPHGEFYTRDDWGQPDQPSIWGQGIPSDLSPTIDWVLEEEGATWGADDDTDIEYMYQHLLLTHQTSMLSAEQIRDGWLRHIYSDENTPFINNEGEKENFLWVSNQRAHDLMRTDGMVPPATSDPANNPEYDMIDAQLTTEIFGLLAPARPDIALKMAHLPIRTTARENAAWAAEFYVVMHSLASYVDPKFPIKEQVLWMADKARQRLPDDSYSARMFDFVKSRYQAGVPWEQARDEIYLRYQVEQQDGYDITSRNIYCNGCFASGINFAASIVSLLYGEGNYQDTVRIAVLAGWDSDNPAATWGGLLGFMHGREGIERAFGQKFADRFNIHRTRGNFPNEGIDTIQNMAKNGVFIIDRVVQEEAGGGVDLQNDRWLIPDAGPNVEPGQE
jgi:imidazolonepropionase-like amidohydrolase